MTSFLIDKEVESPDILSARISSRNRWDLT